MFQLSDFYCRLSFGDSQVMALRKASGVPGTATPLSAAPIARRKTLGLPTWACMPRGTASADSI